MANQDSVSTIYGVPTKYVSLLILVVQNSALVLCMRYSRVLPGPRYLSSTAVVLSELLKCVICLFIHLREQRSNAQYEKLPTLSDGTSQSASQDYSLRQLYADVFSAKSGFLKLLVPAVLYTLQNNLQFVAASNLDAATFQVTYQCKILTTALFAVLLLHQSLSWKKWLSLFILTAGVACVQIPSGGATPAASSQEGNYFVGITAVAIACICSGFAGVYFEKVLKTSNSTSIWVRNIQLSVNCLAIAVVGALMWDGKAIQEHGFFQGYNTIVVATVCIQAAGGLIVAMVIKYADNILKGFATSLSIVLSTVVSVFAFDFVITVYFGIGTVFVFAATYLYSMPDRKTEPAVAQEPKEEESTPMLVIEDHDAQQSEKLEYERETSRPKSPFRDESDLESGDERSFHDGNLSARSSFAEGRSQRNFSPSMLHQGTFPPRPTGKVVDELGQVQ